jgi:hypothetical protein
MARRLLGLYSRARRLFQGRKLAAPIEYLAVMPTLPW